MSASAGALFESKTLSSGLTGKGMFVYVKASASFSIGKLLSLIPHMDTYCENAIKLNVPLSREMCGEKEFAAGQITLDLYASDEVGIGFKVYAQIEFAGFSSQGGFSVEQTPVGWKLCGTVGSKTKCAEGCISDSQCKVGLGKCENYKCVQCTEENERTDCATDTGTGECYDGICYAAVQCPQHNVPDPLTCPARKPYCNGGNFCDRMQCDSEDRCATLNTEEHSYFCASVTEHCEFIGDFGDQCISDDWCKEGLFCLGTDIEKQKYGTCTAVCDPTKDAGTQYGCVQCLNSSEYCEADEICAYYSCTPYKTCDWDTDCPPEYPRCNWHMENYKSNDDESFCTLAKGDPSTNDAPQAISSISGLFWLFASAMTSFLVLRV